MTPHMTTTHMHGEDGYTDEYGNMDDGYDHDNMDDYNDTSDHQNGHSDGEYGDEDGDYSHGDSKPMEGECSREAMKDWRHAMEKWQKSYKGIFLERHFVYFRRMGTHDGASQRKRRYGGLQA